MPELQEHLLLRNTLDMVGVEDENTDQQAQVADNNKDDKNSSSARRSSNNELNTDHTSHEEEKEKRASINSILADNTITSRKRRQSIQILIDNSGWSYSGGYKEQCQNSLVQYKKVNGLFWPISLLSCHQNQQQMHRIYQVWSTKYWCNREVSKRKVKMHKNLSFY